MKFLIYILLLPITLFAQGHMINVSADIQINGNTFLVGNELTLVNSFTTNTIENEGTIIIKGNIENQGTITGSVVLDGVGNKSTYLGALETFENRNNGTLTIMNDCSFSRLLKLTNGTIDANNMNCVLLSDTSRTALVHDNGGATVGDFKVERFIPPALGHHFLSAPTTNATINQLSDDFPLLLNVSFPNVYYYDEMITNPDRDFRWVAPASVNYSMPPGKGLTFYFNPGSGQVIDIDGPLNTAAISIPLTFTQSVPALTNPNASNSPEGWNFIGNPYPSPIDFDKVLLLKPSYMLNSMYRWDPSTKSYISYINGISSHLNFNQYIPSMQGFWVRVDNNTPPTGINLLLDNTCRVTDPDTVSSPFLKSNTGPSPLLRFQLQSAHSRALSVLYFDPAASNGFDKEYDAYYLEADQANSVELASICTQQHLSINGLDLDSMFQQVIPLMHVVKSVDQYRIEITEFSGFPNGTLVRLYDNLLGVNHILNQNPYIFEGNPLNGNRRFQINFVPANVSVEAIASTAPFNVFKSAGQLQVDLSAAFSEPKKLRIHNVLGQTLHEHILDASVTSHRLNQLDFPIGTVLLVSIEGLSKAIEIIW